MAQYHRLLVRQLNRLGIDDAGPAPTREQWTALLDRVSHAYEEADQERYLHERSLAAARFISVPHHDGKRVFVEGGARIKTLAPYLRIGG